MLWRQAAAVSPELIRPRLNLASALLDVGDVSAAAGMIDWTIEGLDDPRWQRFTPIIAPLIRQQVLRVELSYPACGHHDWSRYC